MIESGWSITGSRRSFVVRESCSINSRNFTQAMNHSDGKEVKVAMQQTAADVDQVKRLSSNLFTAD